MKRAELKKVAFVGGLLIDGTGAEPVKDSLLLVEDGKIAYAGALQKKLVKVMRWLISLVKPLCQV